MRAVVATSLLVASRAHADTPAEAKAIMKDHYDDEKLAGNVLLGLGIAGVAAGSFLVKDPCEVRQGMSYPLIAIGLMHVGAGVYLHMAADQRIHNNSVEIERDGQAWVVRERAHMDGVQTRLTALTFVEIGLVAGGAGLAYYGYRKGYGRVEGAGIGLAIEAAVSLGLDLWASRRADGYRDRLDGIELMSPRFAF